METESVWKHIDEQRGHVADMLESLSPRQWASPSLCDTWTVRDVGAHLTFAHAGLRDVLVPFVRAGFSYNRMIRDTAKSSPLSHEDIIATLRDFVGSRRKALGVSVLEPLLDILVHGQDIAVPLGLDLPMPVDAAAAAADRVVSLPRRMRLWRVPHGVRLVATDADWAYGEGHRVEGELRWILLALTGREVAHTRLCGATESLRT